MEKSQREYYLNEQMKAIQKELGEMDDAPDENEALKRKIDAAKMPKEAKENRSGTAEAEDDVADVSGKRQSCVATSTGWCRWNARSKVKRPASGPEILDTDHYARSA